jgi:23S rRNA pseudouridine1911/1915/1917 synthase
MVSELIIEIGEAAVGLRLEPFLVERLPQVSRVFLRRAIANGQVLVNANRSRTGHKLRLGDIVDIRIPITATPALVPEPIPLDVVFEDDHLVVINKPAGMLVHPNGKITSGTLMNALCHHIQQSSSGARPGLVHRLDRDTSGLIVVAKTEQAHRVLSKHFRKRMVVKKYLALAHGEVAEDSFEIGLPIGWVAEAFPHWQVTAPGRESLTGVRVVERFSNYTLIEAEPKTGRTHQIRIHLAAVGHPLVGDRLYGKKDEVRAPVLERHFLHASSLEFHHPKTGEWLAFSSLLPPDLKSLIANL